MTDSSVRVAVRIRPQTQNEVFDMCHVCTSVSPGEPQVWLGKDKAFTFDHVFNMSTAQDTVYSSCIQELIDGCFKGYNATVLAYGQTGSGKTYTMGTGFDVIMSEEETGIIPRAVNQLFSEIAKIQNEAQNQKLSPPEFKVVAQFMELYNEEIIDLLDPGREEDKSKRSCVKIHEDCDGQINAAGLTCRCVSSASEALQCLKIGALSRTTASTKMNVQSSRSHAIFTLRVQQQRLVNFQPTEGCEEMEGLQDFDTLTSKLHFVDLAGSERLKRTGATGERAREGISINCGLLALGNVISALGDKTKRATHVPYRDSKLTRLLQDSLGGNSQTLMIACVSPSDRDFMETLNTLKYANRAKNIQNKISINQDKSTRIISVLRREIEQLKLELLEYQQGKRIIGQDGEEHVNDMFHENMILESENNNLRSRLKALQETLDHQTKRVTDLLAEKATGTWIVSGEKASQSDMTEIIKGYMKEIEELRVKLMEAEEIGAQLRKQITQKNQMRLSSTQSPLLHNFDYLDSTKSPFELLREAKQDVKKQSKLAKTFIKERPDNNDNKVELKEEEDTEEKNDSLGDATNAVNGDTDDEADDDEDSEDSDSEENNVAEGCDLAQLTQDISMKQQLIEALEESQQRMKIMRQNYEEKLQLLVVKIKDTELERDRVVSSLSGNRENKSEEKVKKAKEEYSSKLSALQSELKKMQVIKKEHVQAMRNQAQSQLKIQQLKSEVIEMKKAKVQLITKMKDENKHHLQAQKQSNSEIAQLKKQSRLKENKIRNLEAEKKLKENILKRKQEEIFALRKSNKPMSDQVAGRVARIKDNDFIVRRNFASPKMAKSKWHSLEKTINQLVMKKQSVCNTAKDMERYLKERDSLKKKLEHLKEKRNSAVHRKNRQEVIHDYDDNIETLNATIEYCQENISDCQTTIMQVTEAKEDIDLIDEFVSSLPIRETKYILGKVLSMAINQTFQVCQKDMLVRELEAKLKESTNSNNVYLQYLERLMESGQSEVVDFLNSNEELISGSQCSSRSSSPVDSSLSEVVNVQPKDSIKNKYRSRKTGIPSELMADSMTQSLLEPAISCPAVSESPEKPSSSKLAWSFGPTALQQELDLNTTYILADPSEQHGMVRVTSAPTSLQDLVYGKKMEKSPMLKRRNDREKLVAEFSPKLHRKFTSNSSVIPFPSLSRQNSSEITVSDISPPNSPSSSRRQREDSNVFSRLTSGSFRLNKPGCGIILPFTSKSNNVKDSPLICTHVAEGHSRPVLSIHATDDLLFSGSKDRTVKVWDLTTGKEIQSMSDHPNNVVSVKYNKYTHLAFSVSSAFVKVWDVRENPAKCLQTLYSSGSTNAGNPVLNTPSRTIWMPPGEHMINDIGLNHHGTLLFSAANNLVRLWDLRNYRTVGKLSTAHQAAIMCLAVDNDGSSNNTVVTGSKDRYIKIFEMTEGTVDTYSAKINLKPPHYDGIESLAICGDILFSSSRDRCIKKWNLKTGCHLHSLNSAHNDWIHTLNFLPNTSILLSGCRAGFLKLWSTETHQLMGGIKAHSASINAIAVNSTSVFTASNDCSIGIWRQKNNSDVSPDSTDVFDL